MSKWLTAVTDASRADAKGLGGGGHFYFCEGGAPLGEVAAVENLNEAVAVPDGEANRIDEVEAVELLLVRGGQNRVRMGAGPRGRF
jgi:hypothetical protein